MVRITKPLEERRLEILDCAKSLFISQGYDRTAVSDIANTLGISQGLVYHYFESKTDLLYAVIDEIVAEQSKALFETALKDDGRDAAARLAGFIQLKERPERYKTLMQSLLGDAAVMDYIYKKFMLSGLDAFVAFIEQGNADGSWDCPDADIAARFLLHGFLGITKSFEDGTQPSDAHKAAVVGIIERVLGAKAGTFREGGQTL